MTSPTLDPARPCTYPRRALVCLAGLSPQVVSETLYALATQPGDAGFVPTELHVVTTAPGAAAVRRALVDDGVLASLAADHLGGRAPAFDPALNVHRVTRDGREIDDIACAEDHTAFADTVLRVVRPLARDPHCAIHGSLAGGRKSMGFSMGYVLSLLGRAQDRLSHVLVNPPFEGHPRFFYPPASPLRLALADGSSASTADARIVLAPVSFVRLSEGLTDLLLDDELDFDRLVARAQRALAPLRLVVAPAAREVRIDGLGAQRLEPALMAWYTYFAVRRQRALMESDQLLAPGMVHVGKDPARSVGLDAALMLQVCQRVGIPVQPTALTAADLRPRFSAINDELRRAFGAEIGRQIAIVGPADRGTRDGQYGLIGLPPERIAVV